MVLQIPQVTESTRAMGRLATSMATEFRTPPIRIATAICSRTTVSWNPLVFDIQGDGSGLDSAVIDAVKTLVTSTRQDVTTRTENVAGNPDDFDATRFIKAIRPREGYRDGKAGEVYDRFDETTFYGVAAGTEVEFDVVFQNDERPHLDEPQVFKARIVVVGENNADLDARTAHIVVPPNSPDLILN